MLRKTFIILLIVVSLFFAVKNFLIGNKQEWRPSNVVNALDETDVNIWFEGNSRRISQKEPAKDSSYIWDGKKVHINAARNPRQVAWVASLPKEAKYSRILYFTEDTVLVAHNAAFDMRMLQINEAETGVKFINPVLDTLLLSAIVHPSQQDHDLEAIAKRLGVSIIGRHTALGDAITTGEIFIKLIPLLAKMGIYTLKDARKASRKTYYSRIKY